MRGVAQSAGPGATAQFAHCLIRFCSTVRRINKSKFLCLMSGVLGKCGTYRTAAYFRDHVINLRFHFSEGSKVSLVVKSHVCVKMSKKRGGYKKAVFLSAK